MKIGIDARLIGKKRTGDEIYFFNLIKNLSRRSLASTEEYFLFVDRDPEKDENLKREINKLELKDNFKIIFLDFPNRFTWNFWGLSQYLKKNPVDFAGNTESNSLNAHSRKISSGIDIFHTQYIAPFGLPKKIKLVLTIHDISFNFFPQYIKKSDLFFLKTLLPRSIRRANKILTVSQSERKNIVDFYKIPPEKVDFVYNGVDFERFSQNYSEEQKEKVRKKYKLPEKFVLYIGTFQPRKNIPVLVEAMRKLDANLVLVGDRKAYNFDKRIEEVIEKNNLSTQVIFPGWVDEEDKPLLLQMAICFVFPSLYEGFGIPVIEAMAAGTPVVCSDIPVLREVGGEAALFCSPQKSSVFAENIKKVMPNSDWRDNLIQKGKKIARKFTWQKMAEKIWEIYKSL